MLTSEIPQSVRAALGALGLRDDDPALAGKVLCTTHLIDARGWLHRTLVPLTDESHHYPANAKRVLAAAVLTGSADRYSDKIATMVSLDSDSCPAPAILKNETGLAFYRDDMVAGGAPDYAVLHRRRSVWVHGLGWAQSTAQWRAFVGAHPEVETLVDPDAVQFPDAK